MAYQPANPNGQATMANSSPVVIASNQSAIPVSQSGTWNVTANAGTNLNTSALAVESGGNLAAIAAAVRAEDAASADGHTGFPALAVRKASPGNTSGADGDYEFLQMSAGRLWVSAVIDTALPAGTNNIGDVDVLSVVPGTGATNLGKAEDAQHTTGDVGVMALGVRSAAPSDRSAGPTDGDYEPFATNEVGSVWVSPTPSANGGLSTFHLVSAASTNATVIKNSTGNVYGWYIYNSNASARKVVFHNTASAPTAGASVFFSLVIPPESGANVEFTNGIQFSSGIAITTVTGLADNDNTAVAATDLIINIFYK